MSQANRRKFKEASERIRDLAKKLTPILGGSHEASTALIAAALVEMCADIGPAATADYFRELADEIDGVASPRMH